MLVVGLQLEVSTEEYTIILSTDTPGYSPDVLSDLVARLGVAIDTVAARIAAGWDDDDDDTDGDGSGDL